MELQYQTVLKPSLMVWQTSQMVGHQRSQDQAKNLQLWSAWVERKLLEVRVDQGRLSYSASQGAPVRLQTDQQEVLPLAQERPVD